MEQGLACAMTPANMRIHPRVDVGPEYTALFTSAWRTYVGARIRNLSAGGCCIQLHRTEAGSLFKGAKLSIMHLTHPDLPKHRLEGRVAWMGPRGVQDGKPDQVLVGVEFVDPHPRFSTSILDFIVKRLSLEESTFH